MFSRFGPSASLRPHVLAFALIALGAFAGLAAVPAAAPAWRVDGPNGGALSAFAFAPSDGQRVYATNFFGGVFRSDDGGLRFAAIEPASPLPLVALAVDPEDRDRLLAVACNLACTSVVLSEDGGASWTEVLPDQNLFGIRFGAGAAFAMTIDGLLRSDDGGVHWSPSGLDEPVSGQLAFDPHHPGTILAGLNGRLWRSADGGHSWTRQPTPRRWHEIRELTFDPVRPGAIYAIVNLHALRSEDGGTTWQLALSSREVSSLNVLGDGTLLAAPFGPQDDRVYGVLRSSDGGRSWNPSIDPGNPRTARPADWIFYGLAASPSPRVALAAGLFGLWRTDDSGTTWQPASRGIAAHSISTVRASAGGEPRVYAAATFGFFARDERTGVWRKTYRGPIVPGAELHPGWFHNFWVDPGDSLHLVAVDEIELLESRDGGRSWRSFRPAGIAANANVVVSGTTVDWASGAIYTAAFEYVLGPQGLTWVPRLGVTRDGGRHWERLRPFFPIGQVLGLAAFSVDPHDPSILWAKTAEAGLLHSANRGRSWQRIGRGLPPVPGFFDHFPSALGFDPNDARTLLASVPGSGIWKSEDGGFTFRRFGRGLEFSLVNELLGVPDPETGITLWLAGAAGEGIFRLEGDRWKPAGTFAQTNLFSGSLAIDPTDPRVIYAGTSGRSVVRLNLQER